MSFFFSLILERDENHCCRTCDDIRNAYAEKGWGLKGAFFSYFILFYFILFHFYFIFILFYFILFMPPSLSTYLPNITLSVPSLPLPSDFSNIAQCVNEGFLERVENMKEEGCAFKGHLLVCSKGRGRDFMD